jgi:hypothetical protein
MSTAKGTSPRSETAFGSERQPAPMIAAQRLVTVPQREPLAKAEHTPPVLELEASSVGNSGCGGSDCVLIMVKGGVMGRTASPGAPAGRPVRELAKTAV